MANNLSDLNNHLFAQIERLSAADLSGERIDQEFKRARKLRTIEELI